MTEHGARPGFGLPHPGLVTLLESLTPTSVERIVWPEGIVLDVAAYLTPARVPPELVTSIRCIVRVGDRIVLCRAPDTQHVWPGGRRLPDETYAATARREVHEETGWLIEERDLRLLGFVHMRHTRPLPVDHPYPHPDFVQLVHTAPARDRDRGQGDHWVDLDGWELGHRLLTPKELGAVDLSAAQRAFLSVLPDLGTS